LSLGKVPKGLSILTDRFSIIWKERGISFSGEKFAKVFWGMCKMWEDILNVKKASKKGQNNL